ncbi:10432_t:CDS:2 [Entrophospora sp. SA101]|nr:10432_t:CDS:2 [Entrophospora sp. SA101]
MGHGYSAEPLRGDKISPIATYPPSKFMIFRMPTDLEKEVQYDDLVFLIFEKLSLRHNEHIAVYGEDNELRLTGAHETGHISQFSSGVANRGASIRIPRHVAAQGYGYMEDRRPASNIDPYRVTHIIVETTLS